MSLFKSCLQLSVTVVTPSKLTALMGHLQSMPIAVS